ncbi:fimbrial protein [Providencia rettgeri]
MNVFCGPWLLILLMGITGANSSEPTTPLVPEARPISALPSDTRCSLSVSNQVVDYGIMSRWQLENIGEGRVSPGRRSLMVSVACPYSRTMSLRVEGSEGGLRYGEHGTIRLYLPDAQLDGNAVELHTVTLAGVIKESGGHRPELNAGQRLVAVMQGRLAKGKTLTARLEIQPVLMESDARVSNRQRSETMLTLILDD